MNKIYGLVSFVLVTLCFAACSKDEISYSGQILNNNELKTVLIKKGYQFNVDGNLLLDNKAKSTTSLDLSGTKLKDLSGLNIFPNLVDVKLSDNGYGPDFDFAQLPQQITGVDLTGNDIYNYKNLVKVIVEDNGEETIANLCKLTKLYLPASAKNNMEDLVPFYSSNKQSIMDGTLDMKMEDTNGKLQVYTTLREVPDEHLRTYLQTSFPDLFSDNRIELGKRMKIDQKAKSLAIEANMNVMNFEGIQYVIGNPYWEGASIILDAGDEEQIAFMPDIKIGKLVTSIYLNNIGIKNIDFSEAIRLRSLSVINNPLLTQVDLSISTVWGQRNPAIETDFLMGSYLALKECPKLKEIKLPKSMSLKAKEIDLENLEQLEGFDASNIKMLNTLRLGNLGVNCKLKYPQFETFEKTTPAFGCSKSTFEREETQAFLKKYFTDADKKLKYQRLSDFTSNFYWVKALEQDK